MKYDYEAEKLKAYKRNLKDIPDVVKNKSKRKKDWEDLLVRVHNFINRFKSSKNDPDFNEPNIIKQIENNRVVAASFIKEPSRQNFYQNQALRYLNSMTSTVKSAELLPSTGKNAMFIIGGKLGKKADFTDTGTCKSIDFRIELKDGRTILASHKFTDISGGSQDNQRNDLLGGFINHAKLYNKDDFIFVAIADGPYYQIPRVAKKLEIAAEGKVLVCNMENFEEKIKKFKVGKAKNA
ncbi:hypothetical protein IKF23_03775 [Candidatus Saccharibacteria bacterium]|nr:hypothetical protein [Candidatus Saccharibacteria bacterium]